MEKIDDKLKEKANKKKEWRQQQEEKSLKINEEKVKLLKEIPPVDPEASAFWTAKPKHVASPETAKEEKQLKSKPMFKLAKKSESVSVLGEAKSKDSPSAGDSDI